MPDNLKPLFFLKSDSITAAVNKAKDSQCRENVKEREQEKREQKKREQKNIIEVRVIFCEILLLCISVLKIF
jgi:hypothetical protein